MSIVKSATPPYMTVGITMSRTPAGRLDSRVIDSSTARRDRPASGLCGYGVMLVDDRPVLLVLLQSDR